MIYEISEGVLSVPVIGFSYDPDKEVIKYIDLLVEKFGEQDALEMLQHMGHNHFDVPYYLTLYTVDELVSKLKKEGHHELIPIVLRALDIKEKASPIKEDLTPAAKERKKYKPMHFEAIVYRFTEEGDLL